MNKKILTVVLAVIFSLAIAVPTLAASRSDDRSLGYTAQILRQSQDTPEVTDEDIDVNSPISIGVAVSFTNLNGDTANIGIGSRSARNRAMNDSMGKADLYALLNPLRIGISEAVRI